MCLPGFTLDGDTLIRGEGRCGGSAVVLSQDDERDGVHFAEKSMSKVDCHW